MRHALPLILSLLIPAVATAQPAQVTRVLHTIDFEERHLGNPEELPMHWSKIEGAGFPHYVNAKLTDDRAHGGKYSFRFDLNGGSLAYRYDAGQIKVQSGAHYRVETFVQTTPLMHARARLSAYFLDQDGRAIPASLRSTEPYVSEGDASAWKHLVVEMSADDPAADSLVIELALLQPAIFSKSMLGDRALFAQDIRGSAWFDDVSVSQFPKVRISAERPGNIFRRSEPVALNVSISDRFTDDLAAQLVVRDAGGKEIYQHTGALDVTAASQPAGNIGKAKPQITEGHTRLLIPTLTPGWYEATLTMTTRGQFLGQQKLSLIVLADEGAMIRPDDRFGLIATDQPFEAWEQLPDIASLFAAGRLKLAIWSKAADAQQLDAAMFDRLLLRLQEMHISPTACLIDLPPNLAGLTKTGAWPELLSIPPDSWKPQLAYLIARHISHLERWQLGADASDAFVTNKDMRQVYASVYAEFAKLTQKPDLAMPWPAWFELDGQLPATVALSVPSSILPAQLPLYMQDMKGHEGHNLSLSLQWLDRKQYGRDVQIRDLAQRVIYALSADAKRIDVPLPLDAERGPDGSVINQPNELFTVVRTLFTTLSGATFKGKVPIADGVEAFLFDRNGQGIIAMWDRGSSGSSKQLALHLGQKPLQVDLWGNVTPLLKPTDAAAKSGQVQLTVGPMPIFLVDIDGPLAQLRASVVLDRPLIESSFQPHARKIRFANSFKQPISGTLKLKGPSGWTFTPPTFTFNLNAGETFERDITLQFPYSTYAGQKTFDAEFAIQADRQINITIPVSLTLGLSDIGMQSLALREGKDIILQQIITNYGDKPVDYTAFAMFPNQARQERLVTTLGPGRTTIKRYKFQNAVITPKASVRVGIKEIDGTRVLNDQVEVQ